MNKVISENEFFALSYRQGIRCDYNGKPNPKEKFHLFRCETDPMFDVVSFNGHHLETDPEHFWVRFKEENIGVIASQDSIDSEFHLDEEFDGQYLLNISAAPELFHDDLVYPEGESYYDANPHLSD